MSRIVKIFHALCVKMAVCPAAASAKKRCILFLYERRIIRAGEVERLFGAHNLKFSEA